MNGLDTIIRRNAEAAGREAAHADNDGDGARATAILSAYTTTPISAETHAALVRGYRRGRREVR